MLEVKMLLHASDGTGTQELGRMFITNVGGTPENGEYIVNLKQGETISRNGRVRGFARFQRLGMWKLVQAAFETVLGGE